MNSALAADKFKTFVREATGGRGFVFVIMPFRDREAALRAKLFKDIVEREFGLLCLRADEFRGGSELLAPKIHALIECAELVIADIGECKSGEFNPNVFYEVGYAIAKAKELLLLKAACHKPPIDLEGRTMLEYNEKVEEFESELRKHVQSCLGNRFPLLRDMLIPAEPVPSVIVAQPRYPHRDSTLHGSVPHRRTFGDNLGVVGLLSVFGSVLGEWATPQLLPTDFHYPELEHDSANLYLIGSKKINPLSGRMLERVQAGRDGPQWYLGRIPCEEEKDDYAAFLYRTVGGERKQIEGNSKGQRENLVHTVDHGIIVRAPHPDHPNRLVTILAGSHSLGTGAACIAATRSSMIEQIRAKLGDALTDKQKAIWVLVKGTADDDGMLSESGVEVVEAGVYGEPVPA